MLTIQDAYKILRRDCGLLTEWDEGCMTKVVVDGVEYDELFNAVLEFDLNWLVGMNCNDYNGPTPFTNHHRHAAAYVTLDYFTRPLRYTCEYKDSFIREFPKAASHLLKDLHSRRAVIHFVDITADTQPCLTTLQFVVRDKKLHVIANFRSWELSEWALYDLQLIYTITWRMYSELRIKLNIDNVEDLDIGTLTVYAAAAHVAC